MSNDEPVQQGPAAPPPASQAASPIKDSAVSVGQILAGILFILVVVFIIENTDTVKVRIIAGPKVEAPVFVWLLIAAVVGGLIAGLMRMRRKHKAKVKAKNS